MAYRKNIYKYVLSFFVLFLFFVLSYATTHAYELKGLKESGEKVGYDTSLGTNSIGEKAGFIIDIAISMMGLMFAVFVWMGALDIVGANGNKELLEKGKGRIKNGAIGMLAILLAYIITKLLLTMISGGISLK